jgi:nitrite reductase/ring-hydroxylating ferredoxin subunit
MAEKVTPTAHLVRVCRLADIQTAGCLTATVNGHTLALFAQGDRVFAVDNRCPHMGFPLQRGTVKDCILTCHWHHARFDLASGGTLDPWADDVPAFPAHIRDGEVWVDLARRDDLQARHRKRLCDGLERDIPLVLAKAVLPLVEGGDDTEWFRIGLEFGTRYRQDGWSQGLTILTCMRNLWSSLDAEDRPRAAYHGLAAVARDCAGEAPRFQLHPLPGSASDPARLKRWFRHCVEVRDAEGAERCLVTAIRAGHERRPVADMLFAAVTDHRYIQIGHIADFTNKALEALDIVGWSHAEAILTSLARGYAMADRMEESNAWRQPVDLVAILERAFDALPAALEVGRTRRETWNGSDALIPVLLGDDAQAIADRLLVTVREGAKEEQIADAVALAAALRVARFHTSNEFGDWDTALHSWTFANAVHQSLRRSPSPELLRGVFDAAMSVYLDRFLNVPAARLPEPDGKALNADSLLADLPLLLNRQQQVNEAGETVARYLNSGGRPERLQAMLGKLLLREDRDFHTIQAIEAAFRHYRLVQGTTAGNPVLVAAARYLAAHAPTVRAQGQTYQIAYRFQRGERLFEE